MNQRLIKLIVFIAFAPAIGHSTDADYVCQQNNNSRIENVKVSSEIVGNSPTPFTISYDVVTFMSKLGNLYKSMVLGQKLAGYPTAKPQSFKISKSGESFQVQPTQSINVPWSDKDLRQGTIFQWELRTDGTFEWFVANLPVGIAPLTANSNTHDAGNIEVYCSRVEPSISICKINPGAC